jgi:hypothetical protein
MFFFCCHFYYSFNIKIKGISRIVPCVFIHIFLFSHHTSWVNGPPGSQMESNHSCIKVLI